MKLVRHLLMISQKGLQQGSKLFWVVHAQSKVMALSEVRSFWKVHGQGHPCAWQGEVRYLVTDPMIRNTLSTTTSGVPGKKDQTDFRDSLMSRNAVTSGVPDRSLWQQLGRHLSGRLEKVHWADGGEALAVDTSVLETMTTTELQKLMDSGRQLHRRFGAPFQPSFGQEPCKLAMQIRG